jgi:glycosyltransferase involved in cell wall biosynthesis
VASQTTFVTMIIPTIVLNIVFCFFCTLVAVQFFYYLFIFIRLAFYKEKTKTINSERPVSIIICAKNEAANLANHLPGVLYQEYKTTHEIIVVNDNSEDESKYVLDEYKKDFKNLNIIELVQEAKLIPGKKFPLSMGIKSSKYETLLLTDADCLPASEHWINLMQGTYDDKTEIVLGYGAYKKYNTFLNKIIRFETFHTALQYFSYALCGWAYMGVGRNLSYKKDVFNRNKGFSSLNHLPSGDDDLFINKVARKDNVKIAIDPDSFTLSEPKKTFAQWYSQKTRHYSTAKYYQPKTKLLLGLYNASFFLLYPTFIFSLIFCNWWMTLSVFGLRFFIQLLVFAKTMKKLNEIDLLRWFWLMDLLMFIYQIIFIPALFKKNRNVW